MIFALNTGDINNNPYEITTIQGAIWHISYLAKAKARGKGYKPDQTKNYGTSRIKVNDRQ